MLSDNLASENVEDVTLGAAARSGPRALLDETVAAQSSEVTSLSSDDA